MIKSSLTDINLRCKFILDKLEDLKEDIDSDYPYVKRYAPHVAESINWIRRIERETAKEIERLNEQEMRNRRNSS